MRIEQDHVIVDASAYWAIAAGAGECRPLRLAAPHIDGERPEILVRALFSGVSRGTEALVARGGVPASQHDSMRCPFQEGDFPFPVKYGYCMVGIVEAGPAALLGRAVFCLHPHQTRFVVPASAAHPLPDGLPPRRAVLTANMETALNAVWDAALMPGERIVVMGAGVVGCLIARLAARLPGAEVTLVDPDPVKAAIAERLGVAFAATADELRPADCVLNASAAASALAGALAIAGLEARIVEVSWHGDRMVPLPLGEDFHSRRLRLVSSQVGQVAAAMRPRFDHARRLERAMAILAADTCLDALIDGETVFADLPRAMPRLAEGRGLCHLITYPNP